MKFFNCSLYEVKRKFANKRIVFFGCGSWLAAVHHTELMELQNNFAYGIDNNYKIKEFTVGNICLPVFPPEKLKEEKDCVVILTSPIYAYEMYGQLSEMHLSDDIWCYAFAFMQMITPNNINKVLLEKVLDNNGIIQIPKIIHSFWFSGEKKPASYQRCVDTWHEKLPDYTIIEWNMDNYDYHKHPFLERAIELGAWAFASDYARLDVLYEYGGIYLDMDVEVFKAFDDLLCNEAILSFSNHVLVDLAVVGSKKKNMLIQTIRDLYDTVELPVTKKAFSKFFQPIFIREALVKAGVRMDGSLQIIDKATIFPNSFFMGLDYVLFNEFKKNENTYCVHYDNFGWSFDAENKQEKKKKDNNLLWGLIEND